MEKYIIYLKVNKHKWTVNGKELHELSILEIGLLNSFFKAYK